MRLLGFALALLLAQWTEITGRIEKLGSHELRVDGMRISVTDTTMVIKGRTYHDLSPLVVGEQVRIKLDPHAEGRLVAQTISARATVAGTIIQASGEMLIIRPAPKRATVEPRSATTVHLNSNTVYAGTARQLAVGTEVEVVGWDVGYGEIDAARIAIYNGDLPMQGRPFRD